MKKLSIIFASVALSAMVSLLAGCKKDKVNQIQECKDDVFAMAAVLDIFTLANETAIMYSSQNDTVSEIPLIVAENDSAGFTINIDFGNGFLASNGKTLTGKLSLSSDTLWNFTKMDRTLTISLESFKIDNQGFTGSFLILFDTISADVPYINIKGTSINITPDFETEIKYNFDYYLTWYQGFDTFSDFVDDAFIIAGLSGGTARNNKTFSAGIKSPVYFQKSCGYGTIVTGEKELTPYNSSTQKIDFGTGSCDNFVTVYHDGEVFNIEF
ncbi:MAG: hypothetical protein A2W91_17920 [Bacteroidetes bacterium GWF2_38_335]|nr:MAG: hypothetical protein A2W91_17920 [Bacteroidetes bacterium GWF2_38_335]OFY80150.1 MAG: hypothetical protein A2281_12720 [Bacteroidetes bacterium RIFOXYA12_FULL_38_20]HBS88522.1 hypothetical protein [Bacteroidales bacterium]